MNRIPLTLVVVLAATFGLAAGKRLAARDAKPPQRKQLRPSDVYKKATGLSAPTIQAAPRAPYTLAFDTFYYWDLDENNELSELEPSVATGGVFVSGNQVGVWHMEGTYTGGELLGQIQVVLSNGSFTVSTGFASPYGIRANVACFPIVGGTGKYAKLTGNCAFGADNSAFYLLPGVK